MTVAKLTEGLNLYETKMTVIKNIDSDKKSVATIRKNLEHSSVTKSF